MTVGLEPEPEPGSRASSILGHRLTCPKQFSLYLISERVPTTPGSQHYMSKKGSKTEKKGVILLLLAAFIFLEDSVVTPLVKQTKTGGIDSIYSI